MSLSVRCLRLLNNQDYFYCCLLSQRAYLVNVISSGAVLIRRNVRWCRVHNVSSTCELILRFYRIFLDISACIYMYTHLISKQYQTFSEDQGGRW
jgi:hypothetical protein